MDEQRSSARDASEVTLWGERVDEQTYEAAHYGASREAPTPSTGQAAIAQGPIAETDAGTPEAGMDDARAETFATADQFSATGTAPETRVPREDDPARRPTI